MRLCDLLSPEVVITDLASDTKEDVLREIVRKLHSAGKVPDVEKFVAILMERERLGSTGIGENIAIPHAKSDDLDGMIAAFAISRKGIDFDSLDQKKVHYLFLLLAPSGEAGKHLKLLARISRLTRIGGFCKSLLAIEMPEAILGAIEKAEQSL
ncbi:MAG: PTS sugar transporter subunit IIA [Nitrospinota bacterium]|nr:PTS sugar transporter subunit IIA [Nitrospinota bacterium]